MHRPMQRIGLLNLNFVNDMKINLQLFSEDGEEPTEVQSEEIEPEVDDSQTEPYDWSTLEFKHMDDPVKKLADYTPEEAQQIFQQGLDYNRQRERGDAGKEATELATMLQSAYGLETVNDVKQFFEKSFADHVKEEGKNKGFADEELDEYVEFQQYKKNKALEAPEKERAARMEQDLNDFLKDGPYKSANDIPDEVLKIYKNRGETMHGAYAMYQVEQLQKQLREKENETSTPGSLTGSTQIPKRKSVAEMSPEEYEAFKQERYKVANS